MMPILRAAFPAALCAAVLFAACEREITSLSVAEVVDESELTFVRVDPSAPPLIAHEVTFWAVQGAERSVQIAYEAGDYGNGKCLLFRVPADAVMLGLAPGDSAQITVRILDPGVFRFEIEAEGITFDPDHPAQLEIRYRWADPDFDGDGEIEPSDQLLAERFRLWQKQGTGTSWALVAGAQRNRDLFEMHGPVMGFTQYALATD